jgi:hypothetical protein
MAERVLISGKLVNGGVGSGVRGHMTQHQVEDSAAKWVHRYAWDKTLTGRPHRIEADQYLQKFKPDKPVTLYRFERADHDEAKRQIHAPVQSWTHNKEMAHGVADAHNEGGGEGRMIVREKTFHPDEIYTDFTKFPQSLKDSLTKHGGESEMDEVLVHHFPKISNALPHKGLGRVPTEGQKRANNYRQTHKIHAGIGISVENLAGSVRSGIDANGKTWTCVLPADYGSVKGTSGKAADGDALDVYLSTNPSESSPVFIISQLKLDGTPDELKCFLGFDTEKQVRDTYLRAFSDGKGAQRIGGIKEMSIDQFKDFIKAGDLGQKLLNAWVNPDEPRDSHGKWTPWFKNSRIF